MATDQTTSSSDSELPVINSNIMETQIYSVLPLFGYINMTISSGTTIYRAYNNGDIPMVAFVTFVFFATFLLDYFFRLYHKLPRSEKSCRKHKLKIGIWVLLSTIMFGFACEFSTFMSLTSSLSFFGVVIAGNTLLFYVYFIWDGGNNRASTCSVLSEGKGSGDTSNGSYKNSTIGKVEEHETKRLIQAVDVV